MPLLEGVIEPRHHVGGDAGGFERFELAADLVEVAQVLALDEVHHDVVEVRPWSTTSWMADDVGVLELGAQFAFAAEELALVLGAVAAVAAAQHLHGEQLARDRCAWRETRGRMFRRRRSTGPCSRRRRSRCDSPSIKPVELIVGQQSAADERLLELLVVDVLRAELAPDAVQVLLGQDVDVDGPLGQLLSREGRGHRALVGCLETVPSEPLGGQSAGNIGTVGEPPLADLARAPSARQCPLSPAVASVTLPTLADIRPVRDESLPNRT